MSKLLHRINYDFTPNGDFIAVDHVTKAASCGHRSSIYASMASRDKEGAARAMIRDALRLRTELPDMPSHQNEPWNKNYQHLALRIGSCGQSILVYEY